VCDFYKFLAQASAGGCCAVAFEYSSHALDQDRLVNPDIQFTTFTNLTPDHLDYHGTMENYFAAKRKLFTGHTISSEENYAILNADDHYGRKLIDDPDVPRKKITYGFAADAHFKITQHQITPVGTTFQATWQGAKYQFETHLLGLPNIYNISAACTNAVLMGASADRLPEIITRLTPVPGRFETVPNTHGFRIIIDYAHTPDALEKLLVNVRNITPRRIICVFGCGGNRDATKRPVMGAIAEKNSDLPIITSDNPREEDPQAIISQILSGFSDRAKPLAIVCRRTAISEAIKRAEPGDTVVIAGKGHESTQEIRGVFYPFSDRAVVSEILEEMQ
jgi:UDP-N-acetylmuramoyl-L-alanyl-D-glutamate--2,6-diaminopimelate ligase